MYSVDKARPKRLTFDTRYVSQAEAFSYFREAICQAFMPWTPEQIGERGFQARGEAFKIGQGTVGHLATSPFANARTKIDIGKSPFDCIYLNYVVQGELSVTQNGKMSVASKGDLLIFDGTCSLHAITGNQPRYHLLTLQIPKEDFKGSLSLEDTFGNVCFEGQTLPRPMQGCFENLAFRITEYSQEEIAALYRATVDLLPMLVGVKARDDTLNDATCVTRQLIELINEQFSDSRFTPEVAARQLGISTRYVHKLFAQRGTTFGECVRTRRLDAIARDLTLDLRPRPLISTIVFRWGFTDLSTFSRAFIKRFGCSPKTYRARAR
jgi:AraC-like DNA-binding protein